jgi:hypothetical protein
MPCPERAGLGEVALPLGWYIESVCVPGRTTAGRPLCIYASYGDPVQERMPCEGVCTVGVAGANPALSPRNLTLQITGDKKAVLSWETPSTPVQDTYMLVQIGGSSTALRPNVTYHEVSLSGLSCCWVFSLTRGQPVGNTDILCASQQ